MCPVFRVYRRQCNTCPSPASFCDTYGARLGTKRGVRGELWYVKGRHRERALRRPSLRKVCCKFFFFSLFIFQIVQEVEEEEEEEGRTDGYSSVGFLTVLKQFISRQDIYPERRRCNVQETDAFFIFFQGCFGHFPCWKCLKNALMYTIFDWFPKLSDVQEFSIAEKALARHLYWVALN